MMKGPQHNEIILLVIKNQRKKSSQTLISGAISPITNLHAIYTDHCPTMLQIP